MVVGRLRKALKRSLATAMAAALMVTSVPDFSVTAMAEETVDEDYSSEKAVSNETEEGAENEESTDRESTEQKEDTAETQESETDRHETERDSETEDASDTESMTGQEDETKLQTETETETDDSAETDEAAEETETEERIDKEADADQGQEDADQGTLIFEDDFESKSAGDKSDDSGKTGTVVKIGNNQAMEYDVNLSNGTSWEEAFTTSYALAPAYETPVKEKLTMEFDVYIPDRAEEGETRGIPDIGTIKFQLVLNNGPDWTWLAADSYPEVNAEAFTASDIEGYSKKHISVDITGNKETDNAWEFADLTSLRAVTIKAVGDTSTYQGKMYIDNVVLKDTSAKTETPDPEEPEEPGEEEAPMEGELVYENNFDEVTDLSAVMEGADTSGATLADIAEGNKAVKYSANLTGGEWENIFQAQFNLASPYSETITSKVIMGFDVYFPEDSVGEGFEKFKAQAVLKSGDGWKWTQAKKIPEYSVTELKGDADVPGYKKLHVRIDMTEFESDDEVLQPNQVTPIMAVIPCLAGAGSSYQGDLYLDNLEVRAVRNPEEENPRQRIRNQFTRITSTR